MSAPKDFFQRQDDARRRTHWLVLLFVLAVVMIILVLHVAAAIFTEKPVTDLELLGVISAGVIAVVGFGSLFKIMQLSEGGSAVATMLGGSPVDLHSTDPKVRQLVNVVEEMSIASGVPVPSIYILRTEKGINAFAAGHAIGDAAIGVTMGCVNELSRDELQGVIAHEFSHILNGDMRLNIRLMGVLFGILCLAIIGRVLLRTGAISRPRSSDKNAGGAAAFMVVSGLALVMVGGIGVFFAKLIQSAVSRQREFLADSAAVQFTRNPLGLAGALYKITNARAQLTEPRAAEASHMFFGSALSASWMQLFATHPPVKDRLDAIMPGFTPELLTRSRPQAEPSVAKKSTPPPLPLPLNPTEWLGGIGTVNPAQVAAAAVLLDSLPAPLHDAAHELKGACALIFSFLLSSDPDVRERQLAALDTDDETRKETLRLYAFKEGLSAEQEIGLVDVSIQALRGLSPAQYEEFKTNLTQMIAADGEVHLFEFMVQKMTARHLDQHFHKSHGIKVRHTKMESVLPKAAVLMNALSFVGGFDEAERQAAYAAGMKELGEAARGYSRIFDQAPSVADVDEALRMLAECSSELKRQILAGCAATVMADGKVSPDQAQLIRAVADSLECPVPVLSAAVLNQ